MPASCQVVIPARLASTRLPEKLLLKAAGKSVLQHTYEAASRSKLATGVTVAVDHPRLANEVEAFGGHWVMTSPDCASGTDRIAEVVAQLPETDVFVNVQGDEPEISPQAIDDVAKILLDNSRVAMATAATAITDSSDLHDPGIVKIVMADFHLGQGRAVYFSRAAVPHDRESPDQIPPREPPEHWHHLGLYAYQRSFLDWFSKQPVGTLERLEKLEQLRAIEAGKEIRVVQVPSATPGIDTQADFDAFRRRLERDP